MTNKPANIPNPHIPDNFRWNQASHILFSTSLEHSKLFLDNYHSSFLNSGRLLCIPLGLLPQKTYLLALIPHLKNKKIIVLMPDDLLGRIADIKIAAWLRNHDVQLTHFLNGTIQITFKNKIHYFSEHKISLSAFEKASGFRSKIRTHKCTPSGS